MDNSERWKIREHDRVIILVEGTHDRDFVEQLLDVHGISRVHTNVMPKGGKTELKRNLQVLVKDPRFSGIQRLLVLRDADRTPYPDGIDTGTPDKSASVSAAQRSFTAVRAHILNAGLAAPERHGELTSGDPRVVVSVSCIGRGTPGSALGAGTMTGKSN